MVEEMEESSRERERALPSLGTHLRRLNDVAYGDFTRP